MNQAWIDRLPAFVRNRLDGRQHLQMILGNTGWLCADKVVRLSLGMLVNIWTARYLGPVQFGAYTYALAFVLLFSTIATLGLDNIVVREIVRTPVKRDEILGSAFLLKLAGSVVALGLTTGLIAVIRAGDSLMRLLVGIVAIGMIFQMFDVIDFWFQSQVKSKYTIYAKNSSFLLLSCVKIAFVLVKAPLVAFALAGMLETVVGAIGLLVAYRLTGCSVASWRPSPGVCVALLKESWPLAFSGMVIAVYMRIDQVMLGQMLGSEEVGIYSAAVGISEVCYFIPMIITSSVSPAVIRLRESDPVQYYWSLQRLFNGLAIIAYAIALPMTVLARPLVVLLFGTHYAASATVLAIHVWGGLFVFLGVARSIWIIAEGFTKIALVTTAAGALMNVLLNLYLIPRHGAVGAAVATLLSYGFSDYVMFVICPSLGRIGRMMTRALLLGYFVEHRESPR